MVKTIVAAFDGSPAARHAAEKAAKLACNLNARLTLAQVIPRTWFTEDLAGKVSFEELRERRSSVDRQLAEACDQLKDNAKVDSLILIGDAVEELARIADDEDVEMLVVGTRERGATSRYVLGSVADQLVRRCNKPVMVVR